ncbi:MAG: hypothetical protein VYD80_04005 [Candidatus Thermoplasmatota archaeon]|nr:hypothetical protein [Candidatus Thermoplasmatota archaeon]
MAYPPNNNDLSEAKTTIVNILKMEGYKLDSGSLFLAFKDAGGEMAQFAPSLEELQDEKIIKSDSEGNIMTVEDFQREKSQNEEEEEIEVKPEESTTSFENTSENKVDEGDHNDTKMESMLRKKEETDKWIVEKAINGSKTNENLSLEITELRKRVDNLEKILKKISEALN